MNLISTILNPGNFHALVLYRDESELELVREAVSRINRKAIELEGTCMFIFYLSLCIGLTCLKALGSMASG